MKIFKIFAKPFSANLIGYFLKNCDRISQDQWSHESMLSLKTELSGDVKHSK